MKIAVAIASRARPAALIGVTMALHRMRSTQHQIDFILGLDTDDPTSSLVAEAFHGELDPIISVGEPPLVRGEVENRMAAAAKLAEADVLTIMSDRTFNITPGWDDWLARAVTAMPARVLWWSCPDDPGCVIPIAPKAYLDAIDWKWDQEIFSFWWTDTWHQEIDLMIHGLKSKKARCTYSGARGTTANGREFAFWLDVFVKTRPRRREQAERIAGQLGLTMADDITPYFNSYDTQMMERCPGFEERFGDKREPSERYLVAKTRAEKLLAELDQ